MKNTMFKHIFYTLVYIFFGGLSLGAISGVVMFYIGLNCISVSMAEKGMLASNIEFCKNLGLYNPHITDTGPGGALFIPFVIFTGVVILVSIYVISHTAEKHGKILKKK